MIDRISLELTNQCDKGCWFCYSQSEKTGSTTWTVEQVDSLLRDCVANGVKAVSFGGGEPLQFEGIFELLDRTQNLLFRSMTTNGLGLSRSIMGRLQSAGIDKVQISIHFPESLSEVNRAVKQVEMVSARGVPCGINLVIRKSNLEAAKRAAQMIHQRGIDNSRIVFLPMRIFDTPTPKEVQSVAGTNRFQSMFCPAGCRKSTRFCSIDWRKQASWCSYSPSRRLLKSLTFDALTTTLADLDLTFCGARYAS